MTTIVIFPSVLGVRQGITDAAELLRGHGHEVVVLNPSHAPVSDDYDTAVPRFEAIDQDELLARTDRDLAPVAAPFVLVGFSAGVILAEQTAVTRPDDVLGVVAFAGAIPVEYLRAGWPAGVPVQVHETLEDPWRDEGFADQLAADVEAAGGRAEVFHYAGSGHLFTDVSKVDEYQPAEAEVAWRRVVDFVASLG